MDYILGKKPDVCVFCSEPMEDADARNFILHRDRLCYVIMNIYPYNNGHLMVIPYKHVEDMESLTDDVLSEMIVLTRECCAILRKTMNPKGFNVGLNVGEAAGAGIKEHLHMHIVPRWDGDTNFMAVMDDTRVMPQHLTDTYNLLLPGFRELAASRGQR
jgi:ATP adenylyltransferase